MVHLKNRKEAEVVLKSFISVESRLNGTSRLPRRLEGTSRRMTNRFHSMIAVCWTFEFWKLNQIRVIHIHFSYFWLKIILLIFSFIKCFLHTNNKCNNLWTDNWSLKESFRYSFRRMESNPRLIWKLPLKKWLLLSQLLGILGKFSTTWSHWPVKISLIMSFHAETFTFLDRNTLSIGWAQTHVSYESWPWRSSVDGRLLSYSLADNKFCLWSKKQKNGLKTFHVKK